MDIQVLRLEGVLPVSGFFMLTRVPLVLAITGSGFDDTEAVSANGVGMDEFSVINGRLILVGLPLHMTAPITSVRVSTTKLPNLSVSPHHSVAPIRSRVALGLGTRIEGITGIMRLTQIFVKVLFTTPGTSIHNPHLGGGARGLLGAASAPESKALVRSFSVAVSRTSEQITSMQARSGAPASERLLLANLVGAAFDKESAALSAVVSLTSFDREQAVANITL
jgi:hypothetical protein